MKLSRTATEMLCLIHDHSVVEDSGVFWVPSAYPDWSSTLQQKIWVSGAGCASSIKFLIRKGLVKFVPNRPGIAYWCRITEDGVRLVSQLIEQDKLPKYNSVE